MDLLVFSEQVKKKNESGECIFKRRNQTECAFVSVQGRLQMVSCLSFLFGLVRLAMTFEMPSRRRATFSIFLSCHRLSIPIQPTQRTSYTFLRFPFSLSIDALSLSRPATEETVHLNQRRCSSEHSSPSCSHSLSHLPTG